MTDHCSLDGKIVAAITVDIARRDLRSRGPIGFAEPSVDFVHSRACALDSPAGSAGQDHDRSSAELDSPGQETGSS